MKRVTIDKALDLFMNKKEEFDKLYYKGETGLFFRAGNYLWSFRERMKGEEWYFLTTEFYEKEEEKFYLTAEGICRGYNFMIKNRHTGNIGFTNMENRTIHQKEFTEKEISELPEWCQHLERVLVE